MAVLKSKPTSPGRRHVVRVVSDDLHKGAPYGPLLENQNEEWRPKQQRTNYNSSRRRWSQAALSDH